MRIRIGLLCIFLLTVIIPLKVSAETATGTSSLKQQMTDLRTDRKNAISQIRDKTRLEIQALRDQFKVRLQTIKDARKRALTQKLDLNISSANIKHTARFTVVLTKLQEALDKISPDVKNPKILSDIKEAQAKIDVAKEAVASQAAKVYTIEITDETALRKSVGTTISQFRKDLMQVHKLVIEAKQAVQILRTDKSMMKKEATSSASQ